MGNCNDFECECMHLYVCMLTFQLKHFNKMQITFYFVSATLLKRKTMFM